MNRAKTHYIIEEGEEMLQREVEEKKRESKNEESCDVHSQL